VVCGACLMRFRIAAQGRGVLDANANWRYWSAAIERGHLRRDCPPSGCPPHVGPTFGTLMSKESGAAAA